MTTQCLPRIWLHSGRYFDFVNPTPDMVTVKDLAHALACINRYTGHCPEPYSVAQHSVLCSLLGPHKIARELLLHDAAEAYVNDVSKPLKALLPDYQSVEDRILAVVEERFGLEEGSLHSPGVKEVDMRMLVTEAKQFGMPWWEEWGVQPYDETIYPWNWRHARSNFHLRATALGLK